jgi:hypothetical protein
VGSPVSHDYYEVLQLSPRASADTVEKVYRLLAKRYHPDNQQTGDGARFRILSEAFEVLSDPERRAAYDVAYEQVRDQQWKIFDQKTAGDTREEDRRIVHAVLSLLYIERRRDPSRGGLGAVFLERALNVPEQHLVFPLWYMKQHAWIELLDTGQYAITIAGIDWIGEEDLSLRRDRLLPERAGASRPGPRVVEKIEKIEAFGA